MDRSANQLEIALAQTSDERELGVLSHPSAPPLHPQQIGRYRIERVLGEGNYGRVYLAHDDQLHRPVAIKVPRRQRLSPAKVEAFLVEARLLAGLDHPNIVPVYDVGTDPDGQCYVVSKLIEGNDLATIIRDARGSPTQAAQLVATISEALHYAHRKGLVHRDVKPANILIDASGKAYVADFGLALKEEDFGKGAAFAGTPAYMSPEQARCEGHRVDGRSDIFSLGVVLYELLTASRPFRGDTRSELLDQIAAVEARPPRQVDDTIPRELERICLKALSKRAADRYTTAKDMADDLKHFLASLSDEQRVANRRVMPAIAPPAPASGLTPTAPMPPTLATPSSDGQPLKIVPKGLRSFDAHDADFFLELLPGPRDREGLPESIRFWKTRIEETDSEETFPVGLICGPSGCGKSSLVKAGLLPRLSEAVLPVYLDATADETETRLLNGLRKRCPGLSASLGLQETLAALRRGHGIPSGKKVLIVLDQFEQWLHARREQEDTELVQALRQCDGSRVQCIVMVRDDFWMAVIGFMRELEIHLDGQNSAAVDLFPPRHAEKVLTAFGRAFSILPDIASDTGKEQKQFLEQAVSGLAQEGKVVCVRLALFAEMMKGKAWTPAALKAVGGTEGVGVTFLEETFSAATAPPEHRYHQKAARAVLKTLLPESGSDIKGNMRSHAELLAASGYASRPRDFDALLRILDSEVRLITPTDPEPSEPEASATDERQPVANASGSDGTRYYQLTHDYLVSSLRGWLTRKQKETRRGRAELLLADRAAVWNARPENRQLPSLWQWLQLKWLTPRKNWTPPQRKMMQKAGRYYVSRGILLTMCLVLLGLFGWESFGRMKAHTLYNRLLVAAPGDVPGIVKEMAPYRRWVDPLLRDAIAEAQANNDERRQLHTSLALLSVDAGQVEYLYQRLLKADPDEVLVISQALLENQAPVTDRLWALLESQRSDLGERFRAACAWPTMHRMIPCGRK